MRIFIFGRNSFVIVQFGSKVNSMFLRPVVFSKNFTQASKFPGVIC